MRLVIADTGPVNYLVLIDRIELLSLLFEKVVVPSAVEAELASRSAPVSVQHWIANPPLWLEIYEVSRLSAQKGIEQGETAVIALAALLNADLLLMDDRKGVTAAKRAGFFVTGTLGVLDMAADRGLIDFAEAIRDLERTSFRRPIGLLNVLLAKHMKSGGR